MEVLLGVGAGAGIEINIEAAWILINPTLNNKIVLFGKPVIDLECFDKDQQKPAKVRKQAEHKWHAGFLKSFNKNGRNPESERT